MYSMTINYKFPRKRRILSPCRPFAKRPQLLEPTIVRPFRNVQKEYKLLYGDYVAVYELTINYTAVCPQKL